MICVNGNGPYHSTEPQLYDILFTSPLLPKILILRIILRKLKNSKKKFLEYDNSKNKNVSESGPRTNQYKKHNKLKLRFFIVQYSNIPSFSQYCYYSHRFY